MNKFPLVELLEPNKNFAQKSELKDFFCTKNTFFRNKKKSTTGLLSSKLDKKKNGYLYEIILFGLNYNAKRIKHQRRQFYVDLQKSHRILIDENIETPFKTRVFKRRLIVFGFDKTSLLNAVKLIKKNRKQNSYFGHGAIADFDKYKTKPGKVKQK